MRFLVLLLLACASFAQQQPDPQYPVETSTNGTLASTSLSLRTDSQTSSLLTLSVLSSSVASDPSTSSSTRTSSSSASSTSTTRTLPSLTSRSSTSLSRSSSTSSSATRSSFTSSSPSSSSSSSITSSRSSTSSSRSSSASSSVSSSSSSSPSSQPSTTSFTSMSSSDDSNNVVTSIISGKTIVSNIYTTLTYTPSSTAANNKNRNSGLSKKNRDIVIGCCVGIGVPFLILLLVLLYLFCVYQPKTDFIDSDGKVVTAYRKNKLTKLWYRMLGKDISDEYDSATPIGGAGAAYDDENSYFDLNEKANASTAEENPVMRNDTTRTNPISNRSNGLIIDDERYYDEEGNELTARNY